jgi:hypothetical protein
MISPLIERYRLRRWLAAYTLGQQIQKSIDLHQRKSTARGNLPGMSALGQKQTFAAQKSMSALPRKRTRAVH